MKLNQAEIEYLSAWAREEWEPDCYHRPAHQIQLSHGVPGAHFIELIKAWTEIEGRKDQDILDAANNPEPNWPWSSMVEYRARLEEFQRVVAGRDSL